MLLDKQAVAKISRLARIKTTDEEKELLAEKISGILQWVEQLNEVNTDGVPQMSSVSEVKLPWRDDVITDGNQQEAVLTNAPNEHGCFIVPKVIE